MNAKEIFMKTMPYNIAKLFLGLLTVLVSVVLFAVLVGIGSLFGDGGTVVMLLVWLGALGIVRLIIMHYFGYLLKAGHIAVITEAVTTGKIPGNQIEYGKQMVKERFATSSIYFGVDKLITGAVRQIQKTVDQAGNFLDFIPGMDAVTGIVKMFIGISLGYIDECCLGYTFYNKKQSAFKSAADGIVIYTQNWKQLLGSAAKITVTVILSVALITLIVFAAVGGIFTLLDWNRFAAFVIALLVAWAVKFAFIDSWILVKMMVVYIDSAASTQLTYDLYDKLCGLSGKFNELMQKAGKGEAGLSSGVPKTAAQADAFRTSNAEFKPVKKAIICVNCGSENSLGAKFCGTCGTQMN